MSDKAIEIRNIVRFFEIKTRQLDELEAQNPPRGRDSPFDRQHRDLRNETIEKLRALILTDYPDNPDNSEE